MTRPRNYAAVLTPLTIRVPLLMHPQLFFNKSLNIFLFQWVTPHLFWVSSVGTDTGRLFLVLDMHRAR